MLTFFLFDSDQAFRLMVGLGHCPMISKYGPSLSKARALTNWRFAVLNSHFWCWDSYFLKEAIFLCIVGLPLFGKVGSGTPVFKILVRALKAVGQVDPSFLRVKKSHLNK